MIHGIPLEKRGERLPDVSDVVVVVDNSTTTMRTLFYFLVPLMFALRPKAVRKGEHLFPSRTLRTLFPLANSHVNPMMILMMNALNGMEKQNQQKQSLASEERCLFPPFCLVLRVACNLLLLMPASPFCPHSL